MFVTEANEATTDKNKKRKKKTNRENSKHQFNFRYIFVRLHTDITPNEKEQYLLIKMKGLTTGIQKEINMLY